MTLSALFVGNESLLVQCAEIWRSRGHSIAAIVTRNPDVRRWAEGVGLRVEQQAPGHADRLAGVSYDWLFSVANLNLVPDALLAQAGRGAINFHDGPLPRHAGLNAPVWAILEAEAQHGITWHLIEGGIDEGDILEQRLFPIGPGETALTLNTKCFEAAIESFGPLVAQLEGGAPRRQVQDLSQRSYHARDDRPRAAARLDFSQGAPRVMALVQALDHGSYANPLALPKIDAKGRIVTVFAAEPAEGQGAPGQVLAVDQAGLTVACGQGAVTLRGLRDLSGKVCPMTLAQVGDVLATPKAAEAARIDAAIAAVTPAEGAIRKALRNLIPAEVPMAGAPGTPDWQVLPLADPTPQAIALWACRLTAREAVDIAVHDPRLPQAPGYITAWAPLRLTAAGAGPLPRAAGFAADLPLRDPAIGAVTMPQIVQAIAGDSPAMGSVITLTATGFHFDAARLNPVFARLLHARLEALDQAQKAGQSLASVPTMPAAEQDLVLNAWNATATDYTPLTMHAAFEAQVARTPDAIALVHEGTSLTYARLNAAANRVAHVLREMGVGPGTLVGLCARRSPHLVIGALGILKAGGAYVPMDPAYPADRIALYAEDSGAPVIVTETALSASLPQGTAHLLLDRDPRIDMASTANADGGAGPQDMAYMIYTSGSTGRPKGVMIEHRNVANFFAGMDDRIGIDPGTWLAVTSLSFDISVLELFWTLSRGFKLVLMGDADRALVSNGPAVSDKGMQFSLYYWGNDDGAGPAKYELLLEGARFADTHGFCAVWTPERHFHAFGGPYPNPAVTGAAVAAVTRNIGVRAGSCVAPLHHPARIAEDWAVIDNLTNGRAGLAMASGWQPDDFVLRPENTPPNNRQALFDGIDQVRRLWRGEKVEFPTASGTPFAVLTQPRPVSRELPIWVTTAGNPATWREAGEIGAHVLTHLLGQSIDEVAEKIGIYHDALRRAGHDPADFTVTLMLHTFVARDRETARRIAREPMKDYLRSAAGLIKQYAWAFPAFKKPQGVTNPMDIDLRDLSGDELEAILDFAFLRYFDESGLFGTVEDCLARVEGLKRIGVTEVACLIDYGIAKDTVLEGLFPLAEVVKRANAGAAVADSDFSIAGQIVRHGATHLQCTPSMARMIAMNDEARVVLSRIQTMMIGGEALPGGLVADLNKATRARILNMYGPTETTIWSTTETAGAAESVVNIGTPIANTQVYVLDDGQQPCAVGVPGELWIGGDGVARGYWQRPDLTAERFVPNPFHGGRMYRTGDLVRWRADGRLDFLGRADHQVKLRGYRIELGEIEAVAETFAGVRQAVVMAREDSPGDLRLVAYVTGDSWLVADGLRAHIAARLPEHMVPAHVVKLGEFPLTPNRKVDRKALPAPTATASQPQAFEAPQDGVQATIAAVWQRVLNVPSVGARDNFFALGGHSLLAVQAHREIRAALGTAKLSITDIFRFPTLAALAAHLDDGPGPQTPANDDGPGHADRAAQRSDAMSARRALRARRGG
ncbi:MupA/Atu3671 family FMN-dependent luciferase-like monooxygenase [Gemmobacter sp.]|uniref:MupA/Atu3671 family FMN-dependent luciferase-like monooxygenase n=1 Tax=Gemmobacter sp. TaxID=1898957 RepID=UPI002AFF1F60|nr:MupA/Atu3671 family FMN-dependent luciferase-like monooxygenase [Gemmobacter sp.]